MFSDSAKRTRSHVFSSNLSSTPNNTDIQTSPIFSSHPLFDSDFIINCYPAEFDCSICSELVINAVEAIPCAHLFCENCINDSIEIQQQKNIQPNCPNCRSLLKDERRKPNLFVRKQIENLKCKCKYDECNAEISVGNWDNHYTQCEELPVTCVCQTQLTRSTLQQHLLNDCPLRPTACPECSITMPFQSLSQHQINCSTMQCDVCDRTIKIADKKQHDIAYSRLHNTLLLKEREVMYQFLNSKGLMSEYKQELHRMTRTFTVGELVDVFDHFQQWSEAKVMEVQDNAVLIHYTGWSISCKFLARQSILDT